MTELTLEDLAKRVAALEEAMSRQTTPRPNDWRSTVGMFRGSEVMRQIDAEGQAIRAAERAAAQAEDSAP